jgi:hypothetical protein
LNEDVRPAISSWLSNLTPTRFALRHTTQTDAQQRSKDAKDRSRRAFGSQERPEEARSSQNKDAKPTPVPAPDQISPAHAALDHYAWRHHCRGLFQMPIAA